MISEVLGDAALVYRRLWQRSIITAGAVFFVVGLANAFAAARRTTAAELVVIVLTLLATLLVQGALVEIVRDLHEGRHAAPAGDYYERTRGRLGTLLLVTVLAGIGVGLGFLLFVVPGLVLLSRWSLIVPLVMVEGLSVGEAFGRSNELVKGRTGRVLVIVVVVALITTLANTLVTFLFAFLPTFWAAWIGGTIGGAVAVPYEAHALTVLYYRLTQPDRPILPT